MKRMLTPANKGTRGEKLLNPLDASATYRLRTIIENLGWKTHYQPLRFLTRCKAEKAQQQSASSTLLATWNRETYSQSKYTLCKQPVPETSGTCDEQQGGVGLDL